MADKNKNETVPLPTPELIRVTFELMRTQKPSLHLSLRNIYFNLMSSKTFREIQFNLEQVMPLVDSIVKQLKIYQFRQKTSKQDWVQDVLINVIVSRWDQVKPMSEISMPRLPLKRAYN